MGVCFLARATLRLAWLTLAEKWPVRRLVDTTWFSRRSLFRSRVTSSALMVTGAIFTPLTVTLAAETVIFLNRPLLVFVVS